MHREGLSIRHLDFRYPSYGSGGTGELFRDLCYDLAEGEAGVVLGGADAGKTTLSRLISGLVPRFTGGSVSGDVRFQGMDLGRFRPFQLVEKVGLVFQNSDEQLITTRCDTEVAFALEALGVPRREMHERTDRALDLFGLSPLRSRNPATLSGGERKRLLMACLAAIDPELWILDEAFEELDLSWKLVLMETVRSRGRTALFLDSRWSPLYAARCSRFSILQQGRIGASFTEPSASGLFAALSEAGVVLPDRAGLIAPPGPARDCQLLVEGLSFRFPGADAFSLDVPELRLSAGGICCLLGENGSGKSTLGKLLCGLLSPRSGSIQVRRGPSRSPGRLEGSVGYMFQNPDHQIFLPSVREELALGPRSAGVPAPLVESRVAEAVRLFGLPPLDAPPALMSYGARKRLQAATYHLLGREFLILDEIDSGLSYREFLPVLEALSSGGAGLLVITHDVALARAIAGRILVMEAGRVVHDLPPDRFGDLAALESRDG